MPSSRGALAVRPGAPARRPEAPRPEPVAERWPRRSEVAGLEEELRAAFEAAPFEDGMDHPADDLIAAAFRSDARAAVAAWFSSLAGRSDSPNFTASVLRCLGRVPAPETPAWRAEVVRKALAHSHLEVRDAALQTAESWGGPEVIAVLRSRDEPEPWLRRSIEQVIADLGG